MSENPQQTPSTGDANNAGDVRDTAIYKLAARSGRTHEEIMDLLNNGNHEDLLLQFMSE
jgi:hypothetical protein